MVCAFFIAYAQQMFLWFLRIWKTNQKRGMIWGWGLCSTWFFFATSCSCSFLLVSCCTYFRILETKCSYLSLLATICSYLSLHVTQVKSIQVWAQVTIFFWICNPKFQLLTCNGVQSLSRKTNSVQECQHRNNQRIVLVLIIKKRHTEQLKFICILYALIKNACMFDKSACIFCQTCMHFLKK